MRILALDPATKCGWAFSQAGGAVVSGTWDLSTRRDESVGMKLLRFESKLREIVAMGVDLVVFETPALRTPYPLALVSHAKFVAVIELLYEECGIKYRGYSPNEIKKFATGKGNAKKAMVRAAVLARFNHQTADENESDAVALLHLAKSEYDAVRRNQPRPPIAPDEERPF